jgi:hypothetical protein
MLNDKYDSQNNAKREGEMIEEKDEERNLVQIS